MSADDTTGIMITKRRDGQPGNEYRVAWAQAIENIELEPDYPSMAQPALNRESVRTLFAKSQVFFREEDALTAASRIESRWEGGTEYGIKKFDFSTLYFPASDRKRQRRQFRRRMEQRA